MTDEGDAPLWLIEIYANTICDSLSEWVARSASFADRAACNLEGVWRIKFCFESAQPLSMNPVQASNLVTLLQEMGESDLALEIDDAVQRAQRYATM